MTAKTAEVWEVTSDDKVVLTGAGDSAEALAKKLLARAREWAGRKGATTLVMHVSFNSEGENWDGILTVLG